jgi:hypothetical protein
MLIQPPPATESARLHHSRRRPTPATSASCTDAVRIPAPLVETECPPRRYVGDSPAGTQAGWHVSGARAPRDVSAPRRDRAVDLLPARRHRLGRLQLLPLALTVLLGTATAPGLHPRRTPHHLGPGGPEARRAAGADGRTGPRPRPDHRPTRPDDHRRQGLRLRRTRPLPGRRGATLLRPSYRSRTPRPGEHLLKPIRQLIESVNDTLKGQLDLELHGGRTIDGVGARVAQRLLALTAAMWHNRAARHPIFDRLLPLIVRTYSSRTGGRAPRVRPDSRRRVPCGRVTSTIASLGASLRAFCAATRADASITAKRHRTLSCLNNPKRAYDCRRVTISRLPPPCTSVRRLTSFHTPPQSSERRGDAPLERGPPGGR